MKARTLLVVGVLAGTVGSALVGAAGSGAAAAGRGSAAHATTATSLAGDARAAHVSAYTANDLRSPATWRAARTRVLRARLAAIPHATGSTVVIASYPYADALPIGDVDHDGTADVLSVRLQTRTPAISVMSGRSGRTVWSHPDTAAYAAIYVAAHGAVPVVLILSDSQTDEDAFVGGAAEDVFTVTAIRADNGVQAWSTSITGLIEYDVAGFRVVGAGELDGVLTRTTAMPYLLLDRFSEGDAFVGAATSTTPEVIDAATGAAVSAGQPIAADDYAFASPVDDLNGDGTDDYVVATSGDAAAIEALSSASGAPLWAVSLSSPGSSTFLGFVRGTPDLTGDHKPDLLAGWYDGATFEVAALSGAAGSTVWTHSGDYASPLGDIDHDGRSDTRVVTFNTRVTYAAVTATGRTAWSRDVLTPPGQVIGLSYPVGDLNSDGAVDTYLRFVPRSGLTGPSGDSSTAAVAAYTVDGRTGRLRAVHDLGLPTGDSLYGHAMTFVQTLKTSHGVRITAFDGATDRAYWHTSLSSADATNAIDVSVLPLSGGRRGIVELLGGRATQTVAVFDGKRGTRQWATAYPTEGEGFFVIA